MARFVLNIDNMRTKAFRGGEAGKAAELAFILNALSTRMDTRGEVFTGPVFDSNGNPVGDAWLAESEPKQAKPSRARRRK